MSFALDPEADRPTTLKAGPRVGWRIDAVAPLPGYRLKVRFRDGLEGLVEMRDLILSPGAGVFAALRDPNLFEKVQIVLGAVTWPGDLDLAPDAMYDEIKLRGVWQLERREGGQSSA